MSDEQDPFALRFRINIQRGDGPDRRGDVTIERRWTREELDEMDDPEDRMDVMVPDPTGKYIESEEVTLNTAAFAEWYMAVKRGVTALESRLHLDE